MRICSNEGHILLIRIFKGNADLIFFKEAIYIPFELWPKLFCATEMKHGFLSICLSLMLGIAACELAHSFFHFLSNEAFELLFLKICTDLL